MIPVITGIMNNGVYDFGKYMINSLQYAITNFAELSQQFKERNPRAIQQVNTLGNITGSYNTVNNFNIQVYADSKEDINHNITRSNLKEISDKVTPLLSNSQDANSKKEKEYYESVELELQTISKGNEKIYKGIIKDIDSKSKKVVFIDGAVKKQFDLENTFFMEKPYIVSIYVWFNPIIPLVNMKLLNI